MLYALLNAVSTIAQTATPTSAVIATVIPTAVPTATPAPLPISIANGASWVDIVGVILQVIGIAATVYLGYTALKASQTANSIAEQQLKREEEMRKQEAKIAIMDNAYSVFYFFMIEICNFNYYNSDKIQMVKFLNRQNEIKYLSRLLFKDNTFMRLILMIDLVESITFSFNQQVYNKTLKQISTKYQELKGEFYFESSKKRNKRTMVNDILAHIHNQTSAIFEEYRFKL